MKMIDYRRSAADDFNLSIFSGTSHRILPFFGGTFLATETGAPVDCRWIVGRETDLPAGSIIVSVPPRLTLIIDIGKLLSVSVTHNETVRG
jgi:hypothetical protein